MVATTAVLKAEWTVAKWEAHWAVMMVVQMAVLLAMKMAGCWEQQMVVMMVGMSAAWKEPQKVVQMVVWWEVR